jgi:hypothetical protein
LGAYVGQFLGDYILQVSVALVVLTGATAAWIIAARRPYVKSVEFKRVIEAIRIEFRRSIDEARTATRRATAVGDKLVSVIEQLDTCVTDLNVRLAKLEEHAHAVEVFMARSQKNGLQENEQIAARLGKLEQKLIALTDQVSSIHHTVDAASLRDQKRNNSIEVTLRSTQKQMEDLFRRLELGEQARVDLGSLISLFVKQLKRVNIASAETVVRVAELEGLRAKMVGLEERLGLTLAHESHGSGANVMTDGDADIRPALAKPSDQPDLIETSNGSVKGKPTTPEEPLNEPPPDVSIVCEHSSATGANGHA